MKNSVFPILIFLILAGFFLFSFFEIENVLYFENLWTPPEKSEISVLSVGDIMFDRGVKKRMDKGVDPFHFFEELKFSFRPNINFLTANLEGPITNASLCQKKAYSFKFSTTTAELLAKVGMDGVSISNNHYFDCFGKGESDTKKYLSLAGVGFFGGSASSSAYSIQEYGGKKIGFLGIDESIRKMDKKKIAEFMKKLKGEADFAVVNIHWGEEYNPSFTKSQQESGHFLIDNGADVIIGHHPHVVEPVEIYKNKPVFYSLGNFIFDQIGEKQNEGIAVGMIFGEKENFFHVIPYKITNSQPRILPEEERLKFCKNFLKNIHSAEKCNFK